MFVVKGACGLKVITKSILIIPKLFSYGTLQYLKVQMDTYGRLLKGIVE